MMDAIDGLVGILDAYNVAPYTRAEEWADWMEECERRMDEGDGVLRPRMPFSQSALFLRENDHANAYGVLR